MTAAEIAKRLWDQHRTRSRFESIKNLLSSPTEEPAYTVQAELVKLLTPAYGERRGYKVGLTSPRVQKLCGGDQPVAGVLLAERIHASACRIESARFVRFGIESELCVRLAKDLAPSTTPHSFEEIADAVGGMAAAFELVDDRQVDYSALDVPSLIADNAWNEGVVLGEMAPLTDVSSLDGTLYLNGTAVDRGNSRDVLGHPLTSVQWLSAHLNRTGAFLRAGDLVMTGSISPPRFVQPGEHYRFELAGLPAVELFVD